MNYLAKWVIDKIDKGIRIGSLESRDGQARFVRAFVIQVSYQPKFRDTFRFLLYHLPRESYMRLFFLGYVFYVTWLIWRSMPEIDGTIVRVISFILMESLFIGLGLLLLMSFTMLFSFLANVGRWGGVVTTSITEDCLLEETPHNRIEIKWTGIRKFAKTRNLILVYSVASGLVNFIPRRAFSTSEEFDEFFREVQARIDGAEKIMA